MSAKYLGEIEVDWRTTDIFKNFDTNAWCLYFIERYGQIDGDHHSKWVMDQVVRLMHGTDVIVKKANWDNGHFEYRVTLMPPGSRYWQWRQDMKGNQINETDEESEYEYEYDEGTPP